MSGAADHGRWEDDLAAYALGALGRGEADAMERHMARCERCQERLQWLKPAVDVLPASVEQLPPPPKLRKRLVDTVRREAAAKAPRRRRPRWLAAPRPAVALGTLAAVAAGVVGYALHDGDQSSTAPFNASKKAPGASAEIEWQGDSGTLTANRLPKLPGRDVYEVWLQHGQRIRPSSLFVLDRGRRATVAIPSGLDRASRVMVTREPHGGSEQPTTKPLLRAGI